MALLFLAVAVGYHGVTEIMQWLVPDNRNSYRKLISQDQLDNWIIVVSIALVLYSISYVFLIRRRKPPGAQQYFVGLKPKWLIVTIAPLVALTIAGSHGTGYQPPGTAKTGSAYLFGGLAEQFLILVVGVAGAALIAQRGTRWVLPTLLAESVIMSLGGERRSVVFACLITLYGLGLAGIKLPRKALAIGLVSALSLVLALSASREVVGRSQFDEGQGAQQRASAVLAGGNALDSSDGWSGVEDDTIYRLDGNAFGAVVDSKLGNGFTPVGLVTVRDTLLLMIPSFLYPGKMDLPIERRNEETYFINHFSMGYIDYIPGLLGASVTYFGRWGLMIIVILLGTAFAAVDRAVMARRTPASLAFGSGMFLAVLIYEQDLPGILVNTRGALVLSGAVWIGLHLGKKAAKRRSRISDDKNTARSPVTAGT